MARYAPLPSVDIDPRNEAEIVQQAAQRVYEASGQTLNDFSAGNPLAALLEGMAFAQGEFLFRANQLPQSILIEWLGPFLGAMRRLGTPSVARLTLTIPPSDTPTSIPVGTAFTTDSNLTGGEVFTFVTDADVIIPAGESIGYASVASQYVGSVYNSPANSITGVSATEITGLTVTNPLPATGGSDVETYPEVQERFFTLIRRRNPVSAEDWQDFFTDFYGVGTQTSVQPNRPNQGTYNYVTDYLRANGQVSFFVLGPDGVELNKAQLERGQNVVNYSVPVENQGHLYPITLSQVQYNLTVEVDANGSFGVNLKDSSLNFRDRLFEILRPGNVFPPTTNPTVSDVDAAFYSTFDASTRFIDPHIEVSAAYNTPPLLEPAAATYTNVYTFEPTGALLTDKDLVLTTLPVAVYYPVLTDFTPYSTAKKDQTIYGNLVLQQIQFLVPGDYLQGQVCYWDPSVNGDGKLHVINENLTIGSQAEIPDLITTKGKISPAKTYSPWPVINASYQETTSGGIYDPEIIEYDYASDEFIPNPDSIIPLDQRPGAFVWVVGKNFVLNPPTNDLTGASAAAKIGSPVVPQQLEVGQSYSATNTWVYTPQIGSGPDPIADPYYNYVDIRLGVVNKYAYVVKAFTYEPGGRTISEYFDDLVEQGIIREVIVQNGDAGLPVYKYKPRFPAGIYLEYRPAAASPPEYYIAAKYFTPTSTDAQELANEGLIYPLYVNDTQRQQFFDYLSGGTPGQIQNLGVAVSGLGYTNGTYPNVPLFGGTGTGATALITITLGSVSSAVVTNPGRGYSLGDVLTFSDSSVGGNGVGGKLKVNSITPLSNNPVIQPVRMFRFFKGDRTFFRQGNQVVAYTATTNVHPLFEFYIYLTNGIFVETEKYGPNQFEVGNYIPYFDPAYVLYSEDTVLSEDGRNLYRTMLAFTPAETVVNWTNTTVVNTARNEEFIPASSGKAGSGNLLRYVDQYVCEEDILSQLGRDISAIKLGVAQITVIPKNSGRFSNSRQQSVFVWENAATLTEVPQLSWYSGTPYQYNPPQYGEGTMKL